MHTLERTFIAQATLSAHALPNTCTPLPPKDCAHRSSLRSQKCMEMLSIGVDDFELLHFLGAGGYGWEHCLALTRHKH